MPPYITYFLMKSLFHPQVPTPILQHPNVPETASMSPIFYAKNTIKNAHFTDPFNYIFRQI